MHTYDSAFKSVFYFPLFKKHIYSTFLRPTTNTTNSFSVFSWRRSALKCVKLLLLSTFYEVVVVFFCFLLQLKVLFPTTLALSLHKWKFILQHTYVYECMWYVHKFVNKSFPPNIWLFRLKYVWVHMFHL